MLRVHSGATPVDVSTPSLLRATVLSGMHRSIIELEVSMTVGRSGWIALGVFLIGFWSLMQAGWLGDLLFDGLIWAAILLALGHFLGPFWRYAPDRPQNVPVGPLLVRHA